MTSKGNRLNQAALNRSIIVDIANRKVSRRDLFAGGAAAAASFSPGMRAAVSVLSVEPVTVKLTRTGKGSRAVVSTSGGSWTLDSSDFSGSPIITTLPGDKSTLVSLQGARYPGTHVALNFDVYVPHLSTGTIEFNFHNCGDGTASFKANAKVDPFLKGDRPATGPIDKANLNGLLHTLQPGASGIGLTRGTASFSVTGELLATAPMELSTDENAWAISELGVSSQARNADTIVSGSDKVHSVIRATKRDQWSGLVAMEAVSGWQINGDVDAFDTIITECHEDGQIATTYLGSGSLDVVLPGVAHLKTKSPSLTTLGSNGDDLHFASMLHEDGSWIHHDGVSLHAAPLSDEPFILATNRKGELHGEPVLHTRHVAANLEDAIASFPSSRVANLLIASESLGRPPIVQKRPPVTQKPPITVTPKDTVQKPIVAATAKTWIPSLEVIRPQDFLNLKFEFANLVMVTSGNGPAYFQREELSRPAYVVVEFPPQAIGEQSNFAGKPYSIPVRTLLSGPTRLVFYVPSTQKTVKLSLTEDGGLLDWTLWSLSVAPEAFSTFSGKVSVDPTWLHPLQDLKISGSREFELFAERTPTVSERLAGIFKIQRQTTADQGTKPLILQFQSVRQKSPELIHLKPIVREIKSQIDPTKVVPGVPNGRSGPVYRYNTNIEIPAMMQMSPDENAHFFHVRGLKKGGPIRIGSPNRTALWHTRLGTFAFMDGTFYRAEASDDGEWFYTQDEKGKLGPFKSKAPIHPKLRAIDCTDYDKKNNLSDDFTITHEQRVDIVKSMTRRSATPSSDSTAFSAERLMLTSLGGFLKGSWHWPSTKSPPHTVTDWTHWSTLGREQFVEIVEAGFLYPTGHPAVKVTTSQRKFVLSGKGVVAELFTKKYIRVTRPVVHLETDAARKLGFTQLTCKTKTTPDVGFIGAFTVLAGTTTPFEFAMVGIDMDGHAVSWTQQCGFVAIPDALNTGTHWENENPTQAHTGGHPISFAPSQNPSDGTKFPCQSFIMKAIPGTPNFEGEIPAFRPTMATAKIKVSALDQYMPSGQNVGEVTVAFDSGYKANGFTGGAEVFLTLASPVSAQLSDGKKFGGMVTPGIKMEAISRKHGPIPMPSGNSVSTSQYALVSSSEEFASTDAPYLVPDIGKLLGVVSIWDLLPKSIDIAGDGKRIPKFKVATVFADDTFGKVGSGTTSAPFIGAVASFSWQPDLSNWSPGGWAFGTPCFSSYNGTAQLRVDAAYYQITDAHGASFPQGSSYYLKAGVYNFQINACDQVKVLVKNIEFNSQTGSKASIKIDIDDIQFVNMLAFVGVLQKYLSSGSKGYHFSSSLPESEILASTEPALEGFGIQPILDIDGNGLTVGFSLTIPTIGIGVVSVMNISVLSEMILPWFGDALTFRFSFCTRDAPFCLSVYGIAGGGFLGIELTPAGIKTIEGSIEFGACVAINFGVASGSISLMAGFYFKYDVAGGTTLTGFVRLVGEVDVLGGIISASIELYLGLSYNTSSHVLSGDASIGIRISLFCFHKTVTVHAHKEFAGSSSNAEIGNTWASNSPPELFSDRDRTLFTKSVTDQQFKNYCSAFGGNA